MRKLLILLLMLCGFCRMYGQTIGIGDPCYEALKTYIDYQMDHRKVADRELLLEGPSYVMTRLPMVIDSTKFIPMSELSLDQIKKKIRVNKNIYSEKTYSLKIFPYKFSEDSLYVTMIDFVVSRKKNGLLFENCGGLKVYFVYDRVRQSYVVVDKKLVGI